MYRNSKIAQKNCQCKNFILFVTKLITSTQANHPKPPKCAQNTSRWANLDAVAIHQFATAPCKIFSFVQFIRVRNVCTLSKTTPIPRKPMPRNLYRIWPLSRCLETVHQGLTTFSEINSPFSAQVNVYEPTINKSQNRAPSGLLFAPIEFAHQASPKVDNNTNIREQTPLDCPKMDEITNQFTLYMYAQPNKFPPT